ncbi:prepilin peptidase [Bradyrhizobium centrolobii]|nr:A24 family peptidase [Bradyrhizobium centrolobii]
MTAAADVMFGQTVSGQVADAPPPTNSQGDVEGAPGMGLKVTAAAIGILAVMASVMVGAGAAGVLGAGLALIMLAIAITDARSFLIPDPLNVAGVMLGIANVAVLGQGDLVAMAEAVLRAALVAGAFLGLHLAYLRLRRRRGIGLGDVKLAAVAGIWLDWSIVPIAIEIAALSALATYALRRYVLRHRLGPNTRLPFGLFFAPAIWIGWLLQAALPGGW